ncbi:hypothetical protein M514_02784, partial [Trichuris suis]
MSMNNRKIEESEMRRGDGTEEVSVVLKIIVRLLLQRRIYEDGHQIDKSDPSFTPHSLTTESGTSESFEYEAFGNGGIEKQLQTLLRKNDATSFSSIFFAAGLSMSVNNEQFSFLE